MEDRDDGIGSEVNTPRDIQYADEQHHKLIQENKDINAVGDLVASNTPSSVFPDTSTPIRPHSQRIAQRIPEMSPIERARCVESNTAAALDCLGDEASNAVSNDKHYTKLGSVPNIQNLPRHKFSDLATMLRDKHLECIELERENDRLSQLVEKLANENHFQNQVSAEKDNAATLAKEKEKLKETTEEKEAKCRECQCHLQIAEQKLALIKNISIDIETDKMPHAETLKKLQDENAAMQEKISELKFELEIQKEAEKNAEIWREKHNVTKIDMETIQGMKIELEKQLENRQIEIDNLNREKKSCEEECSKFKDLYDVNAEKVVELRKQLHVIEERFGQLQELEQKLETEKKAWEDEREHLQKEKSGLEKRIEQLALANYALSSEKQTLLEADNKGLKDLAAWQEKNGKLTLQNAQLVDELKKYRDMDVRLAECLNELTKKDSLIEELHGEITKINNDLKRFRDEAIYLRNEKTRTKNETGEDWVQEKKKLLSDCEHLKEAVAKNHTLVDQVATEKQKNDELTSLLEKREIELNNIRTLMEAKQKRIEDLMEEKADLKHESIRLKTVLDEVNAEYITFRNQAEVQYQFETARLNEMIEERDERLERLHAKIAAHESYPGQSSTVSSYSVDANSCQDITIWDALPAAIRLQLNEMKEKYQDLNALVHRMMSDPPTKQCTTITKIVENKSTDCLGLDSPAELSHSELIDKGDSHLAACEAESSIAASSGSLTDEPYPEGICETRDTLILMLESVRHAEIRGKLSPNIQQLLEHLLIDIQGSYKSVEQINGAVSRFFANLDLALRKTLSASDDNRLKCEKLEKLCAEMTADIHDARDEVRSALNKCSMYEADIDSLKLQLRYENQNRAELHGKLTQALEEIDNLTKQKDDLTIAVSEAKIVLKRKTDLGNQAARTIKCITNELQEAKKFEDQMNERLRKFCSEKEKVKQLLNERELDIVKLECRLVESTNECKELFTNASLFLGTVRASELQHAESKIDGLQKRNEYLKRKYDKREGFLEEMEALLRAMKIRCEGLQGANQLRESLIKKLKKLLVKLGVDLDNPHLIESKRATALEGRAAKLMRKSKTHMRPSYLDRLKLAKIAQRLEKDTAKIEELEKCRDSDVVHIPSWRSLSTVSSAGSRTDGIRNTGIVAGDAGQTSHVVFENGFEIL
uniref:Coiled-coil domain-containing protein n=1 Tax=Elaeophora elaphi TaxID=1147741 RepID=A0A0R3RSV2_9BILA